MGRAPPADPGARRPNPAPDTRRPTRRDESGDPVTATDHDRTRSKRIGIPQQGAPLTSEPPLADAAPLTSEPPLIEAAPLTSEPTARATAGGSESPGV
ncbi:hypothetical protein ACFYU9_07750 [Streptomyces sp. NPDC004327]|uniref:hypothetical protein n=1 Tax=unclassified Streptomyces TaxID=2593676 RepID=UPI0036958E3E